MKGISGRQIGRKGCRLIGCLMLLTVHDPRPVSAFFDLSPPVGSGPVGSRISVVEGNPGLAFFSNPARTIENRKRFVSAAGGRLFGMPELERSAVAGGFRTRWGTFAMAVATLGDSLLRETVVSLGGAWGSREGFGLGVSLDGGELFISSRGSRVGAGARAGFVWGDSDWRVGGTIISPPLVAMPSRVYECALGVSRKGPAGVCPSLVYWRSTGGGEGHGLAWSTRFSFLPGVSLTGLGEPNRFLGLALDVTKGPIVLTLSVTDHDLLGLTPEGSMNLSW